MEANLTIGKIWKILTIILHTKVPLRSVLLNGNQLGLRAGSEGCWGLEVRMVTSRPQPELEGKMHA